MPFLFWLHDGQAALMKKPAVTKDSDKNHIRLNVRSA